MFSNKKLIEWRGEPCQFQDAKFYLIIDGYGNYHICHFTKKFFNTHFKSNNHIRGFRTKKNIPTIFSSIDFTTCTLFICSITKPFCILSLVGL